MIKKLILTVLVSVTALLSAQAQTLDLSQTLPVDPQVRTGMLDCGTKYYIRQNKKTPQRANFHIVYSVGSIQEEDRQDGLAHFLEHMALNGSRNFPENSMIEYLQSIGVVFGENLNAFTGQQSTQYMITNVPITRQGIIDSVLLVLHDWAGFISLNEDDIDKERGVIQEEFRLYEGMASERVRRKKMQLLFGEDNIYARRNMIGSIKGLQTFTYTDIRDFYHKWYRPDMQAFVIVGDFDVDQMEQMLKQTMNDIRPSADKTPKEIVIVEDNLTPRVGVITDPELTETSIELIYRHTPTMREARSTMGAKRNDIMEQLVCNMLNLRLYNISAKPNSPFVSSGASYVRYFEPFDMISLNTNAREGEATGAFKAAYAELLRMDRHGFVQAEFDRIKANYQSSIEKWYANRNDRLNEDLTESLIDNFLENKPYMSADDTYAVNRVLLESITLDELNRFASSLIGDKNMVLVLSAQSKPGLEQPTQEELLSVMKEVENSTIAPYTEGSLASSLLDSRKLKGSKVIKTENGQFGSTVWTLKNGIRVIVKPTQYKSDEIIMEATKLGGTSTIDSIDDLYSINMAGSFFGMAGVGKFSSSDLIRVMSGKQASLQPTIDDISIGYNGSSSKSDLETMLQLLYLYATAPRFNSDDWASFIDKCRTMIEGSEKNPDRIFGDSLNNTIYANNPREAQLTIEILNRISLNKLEDTYKKLFASADGMTFILTGSIDQQQIKPLIEKYIGSLPVSKTKTTPAIGKHIKTIRKGEFNNTFTTEQQAGRVTAAVISSGSVDYSLAEKLNLLIAGQALNNIYMKTIREAKGGAYVVQNSMSVGSVPTAKFVNIAFFMTDTSKIANLMPEVEAGLDSILRYGPSVEELTKSKEALSKQFTDSNQHNPTWNNYLMAWYVFGRDNYTTYLEELGRITTESVRKAAERAFAQKNRLTVVQLPTAQNAKKVSEIQH